MKILTKKQKNKAHEDYNNGFAWACDVMYSEASQWEDTIPHGNIDFDRGVHAYCEKVRGHYVPWDKERENKNENNYRQ